MWKMLKVEMERAFKGYGCKLSIAIGMVISVVHYIRNVIPLADNPVKGYIIDEPTLPASAFYAWIAGHSYYEYYLYIRLIPLLAVLPYGLSYYYDNKSGMVNNYYIRVEKRSYLIAKYISVFVSGGLAVVIPLIVNLLATSVVLPSIIWPNSAFLINVNSMWSSIFYSYPYLYILLFLCLEFVCAGLLASMTLIISNWVDSMFVILLFPYVMCEFLNKILIFMPFKALMELSPFRLLDMTQLSPRYELSYIIFISIMLLAGFVLYFCKGIKNEKV